MKKKKTSLLFIYFLTSLSTLKSQCFIDESLTLKMNKEVYSQLNLSSNSKFKKDISTISILPIYWVTYPYKKNNLYIPDTIKNLNIDKSFFNKLELVSSKRKKEFDYLVFSALIYDDKQKAILQYSESKDFYFASVYEKNLLEAIFQYHIQNIFYIDNLFNDIQPYFLIDKKQNIFVFVSTCEKDGSISYKVSSLEEFGLNNPNVIQL